jgi:hypothetical protein
MLTAFIDWFSEPKNLGTLLVTAPIATFALVVAIKNYKRKSGIGIRGGFGISSSVRCEENWVSNIVLENMKDRAVTIYGIFLRVGHNFYIELEDHDETPLILKPYETYHKTMGEILFYAVNTNTIRMRELLEDKKAKKRIVLSTSEGKYVVPKQVKRWSPIGEYFRNHLTGIIQTVRVTHRGESVGGNINFIVDIFRKDGETETIQLMKSDYQLKRFKNFNLTKECLVSKNSLQIFLEKKLEEGLLTPDSTIKVYNFEEDLESIKKPYSGTPFTAKRWGAAYYYIFGSLYTWYSDYKMSRDNKRIQKIHAKRKA